MTEFYMRSRLTVLEPREQEQRVCPNCGKTFSSGIELYRHLEGA